VAGGFGTPGASSLATLTLLLREAGSPVERIASRSATDTVLMNSQTTSPAFYRARVVCPVRQALAATFLLIVVGGSLNHPARAAQAPAEPKPPLQAPEQAPAQTTAKEPAQPPAQAHDAAHEAKQEAAQRISTSVLAESYGIQIVHIAVTAGGGLVDFRFKILDPEKARQVFKDPHHLPTLVADDSGLTLNAPQHQTGGVRLQKEAAGYILYPNARNAIKAGTPVSVVFGDVKVEPVKAQ